MKAAFITGVSGQDGSYLAELLLKKGYKVYGLLRRRANPEVAAPNIAHILAHPQLSLVEGDLVDGGLLMRTITKAFEDDVEVLEIYNLAALSHVQVSFDAPEYCAQVNCIGTLKLLEAVRMLPAPFSNRVRFYQASTSEMYGEVRETPQTELTPFNPISPYAIAKTYAYFIVKNYREAYSIFACNGILFNHESPRRGSDFITRKVTTTLAKILSGQSQCLEIGNLDSSRDWGHARDYVYGMWLMLQSDKPDDYVLATGETRSVRSFIEQSFELKGIKIQWRGSGVDEVGIDQRNDRILVRVNAKYFRPVEVTCLLGDASKAQSVLGWRPKTQFADLVADMVEHDCRNVLNVL